MEDEQADEDRWAGVYWDRQGRDSMGRTTKPRPHHSSQPSQSIHKTMTLAPPLPLPPTFFFSLEGVHTEVGLGSHDKLKPEHELFI